MRHCIIVVGGYINDIFAKEFIEKVHPGICRNAKLRSFFFYELFCKNVIGKKESFFSALCSLEVAYSGMADRLGSRSTGEKRLPAPSWAPGAAGCI